MRGILAKLKRAAKKVKPIVEIYHKIRLFFRNLRTIRIKLKYRAYNKQWPELADMTCTPGYFYCVPKEYLAQKGHTFPRKVKFSILVPLYNTPENFLREMIVSVQNQTYADWELCLADGSDAEHDYVGRICTELAEKDPRIQYTKLEKNGGISANTNACIDISSGDYISLFDHDDLLHPYVLYKIMEKICDEGADYIYTDEAVFESPSPYKIVSVHYKPDFAYDNLLANNYICHFSAFSRDVLNKAGRFRSAYDGSQDHDMILRLTSNASKIVHIPEVLYLWRSHPQSVAKDIDSKPYASKAGRNAVHDYLESEGWESEVQSSPAFPAIYEIRYALREKPLVSILVPDGAAPEKARKCIDSIRAKSSYDNYEILVATQNGSAYSDEPGIVVCETAAENIAGQYNLAAKSAKGEYLILLSRSIEIRSEDWIQRLLMYAQRNGTGAVGGKLLCHNNAIYSAALIFGAGEEHIVERAFRGYDASTIGYMGRAIYAQNVSAVSADCMMVRKDIWADAGGMNTEYQYFSDIDFSLRLRKQGLLNVFTPFAELYITPEAKKKDKGKEKERLEEQSRFVLEWQGELKKGDPYYNPNFSLDGMDFRIRDYALFR